MEWKELVDESLYQQMVRWRRHLHQFPELSNQEWQTAETLKTWLREMGADVIEYEGIPGFVVYIQGESSQTIAVRTDIDALPIQDEKACSYASKISGSMHACGHDGHMAMLLGLTTALLQLQNQGQLRKSIRLIFQHSEEQGPAGAPEMIAAGVLSDVNVIFGAHLWTPLAVGNIGIRQGAFMAASDRFTMTIQGRGGHGSMPHQTVDTVVVASEIVQNLQTIASRNVDPLEPVVVTIGSLHAGTNFNVIADKATLTGTVRTFNEQVRLSVKKRMETIIHSTCGMHGATCDLQYIDGYPPVVNHPQETEKVREILVESFGEQAIFPVEPVMGGEDFAYYQQQIPGVYFFIGAGNNGAGNDQTNCSYPHHHPMFDIDERALSLGLQAFLSILQAYSEK